MMCGVCPEGGHQPACPASFVTHAVGCVLGVVPYWGLGGKRETQTNKEGDYFTASHDKAQ